MFLGFGFGFGLGVFFGLVGLVFGIGIFFLVFLVELEVFGWKLGLVIVILIFIKMFSIWINLGLLKSFCVLLGFCLIVCSLVIKFGLVSKVLVFGLFVSFWIRFGLLNICLILLVGLLLKFKIFINILFFMLSDNVNIY